MLAGCRPVAALDSTPPPSLKKSPEHVHICSNRAKICTPRPRRGIPHPRGGHTTMTAPMRLGEGRARLV